MYDKDFYTENKDYILAFIVVFAVCFFGIWIYHDLTRNEPIYNDTDSTMADINKRIESIEQRIDRIQERNSAIEKAVSGIGERINASRENAVTVADGLGRAEERLDAIIQRQGRIENIIADIETANRTGKKNP